MACWSCERPAGFGLYCQGCSVLQPPPAKRSLFAVLGIDERYDLDEKSLEQAFKQLSRKVHPDRFARSDVRVRRWSLEHSTELNEAYRTLRDPIKRAEYMLSLEGISFNVDKTGSSQNAPAVSPEFLTEMMELQEQLGEARLEGDVRAIERIASDTRARKASDLHGVAEGFRDTSNGALNRVGQRLARVRYFNRILESAAGEESS